MKAKNLHIKLFLFGVIAIVAACNKLLDQPSPENQLTTDKVYKDSTSVKAALFNIYVLLERQQYNNCNAYLSSYTDETIYNGNSTTAAPYNQSRLSSSDVANTADWSNLYSAIYQCNLILEQLSNSALPAGFKKQILAEATFLRAYAYFYLVNLYGPVPVLVQTDVDVSRNASRSDSASVYNQITTDLTNARDNLSTVYVGSGRIRANRACATALLAKVSLYQQRWATAESLSTELLSDNTYSLETLANTFKATSKESILQLATQNGFTTESGSIIPSSVTSIPIYVLSDGLYNSFEVGDQRKTNWIATNTVTSGTTVTSYRYPSKYKNRVANTTSPENLIVLRLAEQYLIRAEARVRQGKYNGAGSAADDINALRIRAGLATITPSSQSAALQAVANERLHEMFFENADRFRDLKRTGRIQQVMASAKPTWLPYCVLLPIPLNNITVNSNLIQNAGY